MQSRNEDDGSYCNKRRKAEMVSNVWECNGDVRLQKIIMQRLETRGEIASCLMTAVVRERETEKEVRMKGKLRGGRLSLLLYKIVDYDQNKLCWWLTFVYSNLERNSN